MRSFAAVKKSAGDRKGRPYAFPLRHPPIFPLSIFIFPLEKLLPLDI